MRVERQVLFWLAAALVLVLLVALLRGVILPFVAGVVIAYFLNPAADRLTQWGLPRGIAATFIVAAFGALIAAALIFLVPLVLTQAQQAEGSTAEDRQRLRELEESLDQCWDLLRRRRAARQAGTDPETAGARDVGEVERYLQ